MVLMIFDVQTLATHIPLAVRVVLIPTNLNDLIVLDPNLEPA
jgi:hypothetical protein